PRRARPSASRRRPVRGRGAGHTHHQTEPGDFEMSRTNGRAPHRAALVGLLCAAGGLALLTGCGKSNDGGGRPRPKGAYLGLTCEGPILVGQEKGFYEEEGLDVELVKTDWNGLRQALGSGRFDANHTLIMYLLQPIAEGLDVKITGGIHTGCLRVQAGVNT